MIWKSSTEVGCGYAKDESHVKKRPRGPRGPKGPKGPRMRNDAEGRGDKRGGDRIDGQRARRDKRSPNRGGRPSFLRRKDSGKYFVVCRFSPPGNWRNQYKKNVFPSLNFEE